VRLLYLPGQLKLEFAACFALLFAMSFLGKVSATSLITFMSFLYACQLQPVPSLNAQAVHRHLADVSEDDVLERARQYIIDALKGRSILLQSLSPDQNKVALWLRSTSYEAFIHLILTAHLFIAAIEGEEEGLPDFDFLPTWMEYAIRWIVLVVIIGDVGLRLYSDTIRMYFEKTTNCVYFSIVTILCVASFTPGYLYLAALRPILLIQRNAHLQRMFVTILKTVPRTLDLWMFFLCALVFYAGIGKLLFSGLYDFETCENSGLNTWKIFDTIPSGVFALFTLTTTENYPAILYPAFLNGPKLVALAFFFSFSLLSIFFLTPITMGRVYGEWRKQHEIDSKLNRVRAHHALITAYQMIRGVANSDSDDHNRSCPGSLQIFGGLDKIGRRRSDSYVGGQRKLNLSLWIKLMKLVQVGFSASVFKICIAIKVSYHHTCTYTHEA
jgi:hypothetical protein